MTPATARPRHVPPLIAVFLLLVAGCWLLSFRLAQDQLGILRALHASSVQDPLAQRIAPDQARQLLVTAIARSDQHVRLLWCGIVLLGLGMGLYWRLVRRPLRRLVAAIEAMERTGRLVKLPTMPQTEVGVVAEGFNQLTGQLEEQKWRLREHVVELQRLNAELTHLAGLKDDFLAVVNHQLRTPLTAVIEGLELVGDGTLGSLTPEQQTVLSVMDENAGRLAALIEDVLDLSLLKSGRRPLERAPADLVAALRRTQVTWQHEAGTRMVRLVCEEFPHVYMDGKAIQEVLDHLLRNAIRHAPERTEILIHAGVRDGRLVEVSVHDQGPGMTQEELSRLFQPFVHIQSPEAPGSRGSGLGLAFCRQVLERHRGTIRADAHPGAGMTIAFTLPIATPQMLFEEAFLSAKEDAEFEAGQFGVLLVCANGHAPSWIAREQLDQVEAALRRQTHRGDRFVRLDEATLAILAVADQVGLEAMAHRLRGVLTRAQLAVLLGLAVFPYDGDHPDQLLRVARQRLADLQEPARHATIRDSASGKARS